MLKSPIAPIVWGMSYLIDNQGRERNCESPPSNSKALLIRCFIRIYLLLSGKLISDFVESFRAVNSAMRLVGVYFGSTF